MKVPWNRNHVCNGWIACGFFRMEVSWKFASKSEILWKSCGRWWCRCRFDAMCWIELCKVLPKFWQSSDSKFGLHQARHSLFCIFAKFGTCANDMKYPGRLKRAWSTWSRKRLQHYLLLLRIIASSNVVQLLETIGRDWILWSSLHDIAIDTLKNKEGFRWLWL